MLKYYLYFKSIIFLYLLKNSSASEECTKNKEKPPHLQIKDHILCDYDKTVRPVINNNATALDIKFLVHHFEYEPYSGLLEVEAWFGMKWNDEHIFWDPEKYGGVETILLTTKDIWYPDLALYNRGRYGSSKIIKEDAECIVFYHKRIICIAQTRVHGMCTPDFHYYPFDVQNCTLRIGSWFHAGEEIDLVDTEVLADISAYSHEYLNPEWTLESLKFEKDPGKYKDYPNETYPSLNFNFVIRRNAAALFAILLAPILVVIGTSILTLWVDPASSERIFLLTVSIPVHVVVLLNFQWELPHTGTSIPHLFQMMRNSLFIVLFTLVETVVIRYFLKKTSDSPRCLVTAFTVFSGNKVGQLLLFSELNPENAADNLTADDSSNLVEAAERPKEWYLFGRVIDRISFLIAVLVYFIMFLFYIPKK